MSSRRIVRASAKSELQAANLQKQLDARDARDVKVKALREEHLKLLQHAQAENAALEVKNVSLIKQLADIGILQESNVVLIEKLEQAEAKVAALTPVAV